MMLHSSNNTALHTLTASPLPHLLDSPPSCEFPSLLSAEPKLRRTTRWTKGHRIFTCSETTQYQPVHATNHLRRSSECSAWPVVQVIAFWIQPRPELFLSIIVLIRFFTLYHALRTPHTFQWSPHNLPFSSIVVSSFFQTLNPGWTWWCISLLPMFCSSHTIFSSGRTSPTHTGSPSHRHTQSSKPSLGCTRFKTHTHVPVGGLWWFSLLWHCK